MQRYYFFVCVSTFLLRAVIMTGMRMLHKPFALHHFVYLSSCNKTAKVARRLICVAFEFVAFHVPEFFLEVVKKFCRKPCRFCVIAFRQKSERKNSARYCPTCAAIVGFAYSSCESCAKMFESVVVNRHSRCGKCAAESGGYAVVACLSAHHYLAVYVGVVYVERFAACFGHDLHVISCCLQI